MVNNLAERLETALTPIREPLAILGQFDGLTDADYITEGKFSQKLKNDFRHNRHLAGHDFECVVYQALEDIASDESLELDEFQRSVVYGTLSDNLVKYQDGSLLTPAGSKGAIVASRNSLSRLKEVLAWWRTPGYLVVGASDKVAVYPSRGHDNTVVANGSFSGRNFPPILASFTDGHLVSADNIGNEQRTILVHEDQKTINVGLFGWDGRTHTRFQDDGTIADMTSDRYTFLTSNDTLSHPKSSRRFALRAAFGFMASKSEVEIQVPTIAAPDEELTQKVLKDVTASIIGNLQPQNRDVLLDIRQSSFSGHVSGEGRLTRPSKDTLRGLTFDELKIYLAAANISPEQARANVQRELDAWETTPVVLERLEYLRTKQLASSFLDLLVAKS